MPYQDDLDALAHHRDAPATPQTLRDILGEVLEVSHLVVGHEFVPQSGSATCIYDQPHDGDRRYTLE